MKRIQAMNAHRGTTSDLIREGWIYEPKLDGIRALCHVNQTVDFISRNNINLNQRYPLLPIRPYIKADSALLDGEIIAYNANGNPTFSALQQGEQPHYVVFDILMKNGLVLTSLPLSERKRILEQTIDDTAAIEKVPYTVEGKKLWKLIVKHKGEGVMAKDFSSHYYSGLRTRVWLKVKTHDTADCVVMGYTSDKRSISSLALGLYNSSNELIFMGKVGTGFNQSTIKELHKKLTNLPSYHYHQQGIDRSIKWVKPVYVCEIKFAELTHDKRFRAPVFIRLRDDKKPFQCTFKDNSLSE